MDNQSYFNKLYSLVVTFVIGVESSVILLAGLPLKGLAGIRTWKTMT